MLSPFSFATGWPKARHSGHAITHAPPLRPASAEDAKVAMFKQFHVRVIFCVLSAVALFMALTPKPPHLPIDRFGDKFEHILAFATLTFFARLAFRRAPGRLILERMSFAGALIEVFQAIPALHRDCDWHDWLADTLAVAAVLLIMRFLRWDTLIAPAKD